MPITVDFTNVQDFSAVPDDTYLAKPTDIVPAKASTGNKMLTWTFMITDGEYKGRKLTTNFVLIPESLWKLRECLEALGAEVPMSVVTFEPKEVIGKPCRIVVGHHEYKGSTRNDIYKVLGPVEGQTTDEGAKLI